MTTPERLKELSDLYGELVPEAKREQMNFGQIADYIGDKIQMNGEEGFLLGTALTNHDTEYLNALLYSTTKLLLRCKFYMNKQGIKDLGKAIDDSDKVMESIVDCEGAREFIKENFDKYKSN